MESEKIIETKVETPAAETHATPEVPAEEMISKSVFERLQKDHEILKSAKIEEVISYLYKQTEEKPIKPPVTLCQALSEWWEDRKSTKK